MSQDAPCHTLMPENIYFSIARGAASGCNKSQGSLAGRATSIFQGGFTLIELMITIAVLAILSAAALPSFRSFMVGQRVMSASFDAMSALTIARSEAIKRNSNVDIKPNGGSWLNGWTVVAGATILKRQAALGNGLSVTCYSGGAEAPCQTITYIGGGQLLPGIAAPSLQIAASDISIAPDFATRCIAIDLAGRPRTTKTSCP